MMKIHTFPPAPNARRLTIYLREKGLDIPFQLVNLMEGEQFSNDYLAKNPAAKVPCLELPDGTIIVESVAIVEYLEETHPENPMIGTRPVERARVRGLERYADIEVMGSMGIIAQNKMDLFAPRFTQSPQAVTYGQERLAIALKVMDQRIGDNVFVAGDKVTIADCTLFAALEFSAMAEVDIGEESYPNIKRWREAFGQRPSVEA